MFSATAFPRIPLFGGGAVADDEPSPAALPPVAEAPPVVPFDTLVLSAEIMMRDDTASHERNATSIAKYDEIVASVDSEDAREFLAALVFLGTRSTLRTLPSAKP